jgi:FXSXX-COOH protein
VNESPPEITTSLVDLTKVDLEAVRSMLIEQGGESVSNSPLACSLRRILREAEDPASAIAGFESSV